MKKSRLLSEVRETARDLARIARSTRIRSEIYILFAYRQPENFLAVY
jgi:hypothetical protein